MSRKIKMSQEEIEVIMNDFRKELMRFKADNGEIKYNIKLDTTDDKAVVLFDPAAWVKMTFLINSIDKEVAWHGIAHRSEEFENTFVITDILVYPQRITSVTVEMDEDEYDAWLMGLDSDKFNGIRMQGHSHVKMSVSPSSTDINGNNKILQTVRDDMFYIFMIWNKSLERNIKIYDVEKNIFFDNSDVVVGFTNDISDIVEDSKKFIKQNSVIPMNSSVKKANQANTSSSAKDVKKNNTRNDLDIMDVEQDYEDYWWQEYYKYQMEENKKGSK